jgi:TetR/AcrR family transcriptional repressor of lmrAB and yxaGH operons
MAKRGETRGRVISTASETLRRRGYHGTGLNRVLEESGAPRGSLYFHFPGGKQELAAEAVAEAGGAIGDGIEALLRSSDDVGAAIGRVTEYLAADLRDSGYERGCPVGTPALDASLVSEPVRLACREAFDWWARLIETRLREAGWAPADARDDALATVAAIEGALLVARTQRDVAPLRAVGRRMGESLKRPRSAPRRKTTRNKRRKETG